MASSNYKEEAFKRLAQSFRMIDHETIRDVLEYYQYDSQKTHKALTGMSQDSYETVPYAGTKKKNYHTLRTQQDIEHEKLIQYINDGWKVIVLLRGLPGSGKSELAKSILEKTVPDYIGSKQFVFSADDYFIRNGKYVYDSKQIGEAHKSCQKRCYNVMTHGVSPIIIDNTNLVAWEMQPYFYMAIEMGYVLLFAEPTTNWARDPSILATKNTHNVPKHKIIDMLNRYDKDITPELLLRQWRMTYVMRIPQLRVFPPVRQLEPPKKKFESSIDEDWELLEGIKLSKLEQKMNMNTFMMETKSFTVDNDDDDDRKKLPLIQEYVHVFDKKPKLEEEKQNVVKEEEKVNPDSSLVATTNDLIDLASSPMSASTSMEFNVNGKDNKIPVADLDAWGTNLQHLQSFSIPLPVTQSELNANVAENSNVTNKIVTSDKQTNTAAEDFIFALDCSKQQGDHIKIGKDRSINRDDTVASTVPRKKIVVDQGCMTEDEVLYNGSSEKSEHIKQMQDIFTNIPLEYMMDVYEKCHRDVLWTIDILSQTDYIPPSTSANTDPADTIKESEPEDAKIDEPDTLYPQLNKWLIDDSDKTIDEEQKLKLQEEKLKLKKHLEENVSFSREHYSPHIWEIKTFRNGSTPEMSEPPIIDIQLDETAASSSPNAEEKQQNNTTRSSESPTLSENDDSEGASDEDSDKLINVNLGYELVEQLEKMFGNVEQANRRFAPVVQMTESLARRLHALYLESVCLQIEEQSYNLSKDEELARMVQDEENAVGEKNLSTIMDEQLAQYVREKSEFNNMSPDDLATKLTRMKLYDAFPTINKNDIDSAMLKFQNNYQLTVMYLQSLVNTDVIQNKSTLMEPPISDEMLKEMRLTKLSVDKKNEKDAVIKSSDYYRNEALALDQRRRQLQSMINSYHQKGMGEVAYFYSELLKKIQQQIEITNQKASLLTVVDNANQLGNATLDLHYLKVKEALSTLDIYIDSQVEKLNAKDIEAKRYYVITGRGNHSVGGISKIKPAVMSRLKKRNIRFTEENPGLLQIKLHKKLVMSTDI